ncbi:MAG TPA: hypothetical protein VH437_02215 [Terriglobales bacterium]|jgi:hypothetical protein
MKDPIEVLKLKESEVVRVKREIAALKIVARLLEDESSDNNNHDEKKQLLEMP